MELAGRAARWAGRRLVTRIKGDTVKIIKATVPLGVGYAGFLQYDQTYGGITQVTGPSMQPLINSQLMSTHEGNDFSANPGSNPPQEDWIYYTRTFQLGRGDVVLLRDPKTSKLIVKRVIGLAGDTVTPLGFGMREMEPVELGPGELWVESDRAGWGYRDSSLFGPVREELVEAKVTIIIGSYRNKFWKDVESVVPESARSRLRTGTGLTVLQSQ
jgi:hypothetical protein